MGKTKIEWTRGDDGSLGETWNPVRGCTHASPGCLHCYAEKIAGRFSGPGKPFEGYATKRGWTGRLGLIPEKLGEPLRWRKPRRIFVNSMSDLFHESLPDEAIAAVFGVTAATPRHTFQVLTKRARRMREWFRWYEGDSGAGASALGAVYAAREWGCEIGWPFVSDRGATWEPTWPLPNVWLGVSAEDQQRLDERVPELLETPAAVRFLSCEPLLGPLRFAGRGYLRSVRLVIVGGESGRRSRPCDVAWIRSIRDQCRDAGTACFVKQLGSAPTFDHRLDGWPEHVEFRQDLHATNVIRLEDSKGGDPSEWPEDLRVREMPGGAE